MAQLSWNESAFRAQFPAFADVAAFPPPTLQAYWNVAILHISNEDYGLLNGDARLRAIFCLIAHLLAQASNAAGSSGAKASGLVTSATVDKVSVTMAAPPVRSEWRYWLMSTPYGLELLALLMTKAAGGWVVGGLPEKSAMRRVGGVF